MHHRALVAVVAMDGGDGDAGVPAAVPAVGAEVELCVPPLVQEDVVAAATPRRDGLGPPPYVGLQRLAVVALDGAHGDAAAVAVRLRHGRRGPEVAAVGGGAEEDEGEAVAHDQVHLPRRVQRLAARAQGDAGPVLVGVEVRAPHAVPQPHVRPVGEAVHRGRGWWWWCGGGGRAGELEREQHRRRSR